MIEQTDFARLFIETTCRFSGFFFESLFLSWFRNFTRVVRVCSLRNVEVQNTNSLLPFLFVEFD